MLGTRLHPTRGLQSIFPTMGYQQWAEGLQCRGMKWQWGTLNVSHLVCSEVGEPKPGVCPQSGFSPQH